MMTLMNYPDEESFCIKLLVFALNVHCFGRFERVLDACVRFCV